MRFAIKTRPEHQTWEEIRDAWLAADELPLFESAWNWDHFYPLTGDMAGPNFEGWTMLGAMATATRRIRIGCQVTGMIYRHPAVLANMAATVDIMSGGRLELGIGAGWNQMECDAYGIALPPLKERFDRFDEGVEAMVMLLTEPVSNFPGQYVRLTDARCEPKPVQRPVPADHHRRHRPSAHAAHDRPVGAAVELARPRRGRRMARAQGRPRRALRGPSAATFPRSPARSTCATKTTSTRWSRTPPPGETRAWTCASSACRCTSSRNCSRRWRRHSPRSRSQDCCFSVPERARGDCWRLRFASLRFLLLSGARVVIETVFLAARRNPVSGVSRSH